MGKRYTPEERVTLAAAVLAGMGEGLSLRKAAKRLEISPGAFLEWCSLDRDLAEQYARAREELIDRMADELMEIASAKPGVNPATGSVDSGEVAHRRLHADTLKWVLSKVAPKRYGERVEIAGDPDAPVKASLEVRFVEPGKPAPIIKADD